MSYFSDQVLSGWNQAHEIVRDLAGGESGSPVTLVFEGRTAPGVLSSLTAGQDMLAAGYQFDADASLEIKTADFDALGVKFEDEVEVDGKMLRVKSFTREFPFVTIYLKAVR